MYECVILYECACVCMCECKYKGLQQDSGCHMVPHACMPVMNSLISMPLCVCAFVCARMHANVHVCTYVGVCVCVYASVPI